MTESCVFIKLGGSLVTDKRIEGSFRSDIMARIAAEIKEIQVNRPDLRLLIGHGSGSFGHFAAQRYDTIKGVHTHQQWQGFAEVALIASRLNEMIAQHLADAGLAVWRLPPSASARCVNGEVIEMSLRPIQAALEHGIIPLVYGDVALDDVRGGTIISTERVFTYLAQHLPVELIVLAGEVPGVLDKNGEVIPRITPGNLDAVTGLLGASQGVDVTGGMLTKVNDMLNLAGKVQGLQIRIVDGRKPGTLADIVLGRQSEGTVVYV